MTDDEPNPFEGDHPLRGRADTWMLRPIGVAVILLGLFIGKPYVREALVVIGLAMLLHWGRRKQPR